MKTVAFHTLGCKVNQYETEALEELFVQQGYRVVDFDTPADVYVINTCTVTHHGDSKSRQAVRRAKKTNPGAVVAVIGCYVQVASDEVTAIQGVDVAVGTAGKSRVVELVEEARKSGRMLKAVRDMDEEEGFEELALRQRHRGRTRAFVKIQEGCRQFCTYCIIPYARGPLRSRPAERVIGQVQRLVELGYREVVLTGIHVTSYGADPGTDTGLLGLIEQLPRIRGLDRIRLSSLEPTYLTREVIEKIAQLEKVCRHFHLSLQSGCDETLRRMGRRYTTGEYRKIVEGLKEALPDVAVTTDVMVGFPGETGEEFEKTYRFLQSLSLYNMHVFKFSPRKGTPAARYGGQVSAKEKDERSGALIELAARCRKSFHERFVGRSLDVLYEQWSRELKGHYEGLTGNYIKVLVPARDDLNNRIITTRLVESTDGYMKGET